MLTIQMSADDAYKIARILECHSFANEELNPWRDAMVKLLRDRADLDVEWQKRDEAERKALEHLIPVPFVVGKFYRFRTYGFNNKVIPALCVSVLKRKVFFQYLCKRDKDGRIVKVTESRNMGFSIDKVAYCRTSDRWCSCMFDAKDVCEKPQKWDFYEEEKDERLHC